MKVSEMMKYPKLKELLKVNWDNGRQSGRFGDPDMTENLCLAFDWPDSYITPIYSDLDPCSFWQNLSSYSVDVCRELYPSLFTLSGSGKYHEQMSMTSLSDDFNRNAGVTPYIFVTPPTDSPKRNAKVKDLNTLPSYQLVARLLLNTSHEYNGHKQVIFNTYITQEDLLSIADCINKILEEEEREGFVTIRWSGPKSVDLYINDAWGGEGDNGHKDKLIAAWEW